MDSGSSSLDSSLSLVIECNKNVKKTDVEESIVISNATSMPLVGDDVDNVFRTSIIPRYRNIESSLYIDNNTIYDAAGNINSNVSNTFYWTFTSEKPTASLTSSNVYNGSISSLSEVSMNAVIYGSQIELEASDLVLSNATIQNFTEISSNSTSVSYTFDLISTTALTESSVFIPSGAFSDEYGVNNIKSSTFVYTFNDTVPTVVVSSSSVTHNGKTNKSIFDFTFSFSTAINGFILSDVEASGGSFDTLVYNGNNVYSSTLTPNISSGTITVNIPENKVTDVVTNVSNAVSNTFTFGIDYSRLILDVSANIERNSSNNVYDVEMTITGNKEIANLTKNHFTKNNCVINDVKKISDSQYTAYINPINNDIVSINIPEGVVYDAYGNINNELSGGLFEWTFDTVAVFINLTTDGLSEISGSVVSSQTINFVASINDDHEELLETDLSFTNLELSSFTKRAGQSIYDIALKAPVQGLTSTFFIPENVIQDSAQNNNLESTKFSWVYDTSLPTITITSNDISSGDSTNTASIGLIFTLSEPVQSFDVTNITIVNGSIQSGSFVKASDTIYNATLVANSGYNGSMSVKVDAGQLQDSANGSNSASDTFIWNCDTVAPQFIFSFNDDSHANGVVFKKIILKQNYLY